MPTYIFNISFAIIVLPQFNIFSSLDFDFDIFDSGFNPKLLQLSDILMFAVSGMNTAVIDPIIETTV